MQMPKIDQRVVWKSPVPEERLCGRVTGTGINQQTKQTWVRIKFDDFSPQKTGPREISGRTLGQEMYFSCHEYKQHFSEEDKEES